MVVAQLIQLLLPTPEVCGSNQAIGKLYINYLLTVICIEKTKIKGKMPGIAYLKKNIFSGKNGKNLSQIFSSERVFFSSWGLLPSRFRVQMKVINLKLKVKTKIAASIYENGRGSFWRNFPLFSLLQNRQWITVVLSLQIQVANLMNNCNLWLLTRSVTRLGDFLNQN